MYLLNRRRFLRNLSLATSGLLLPSFTCGRSSSEKRLGVALVGLGYYSTDLLAPALQLTQHCYLAGIVTGKRITIDQ